MKMEAQIAKEDKLLQVICQWRDNEDVAVEKLERLEEKLENPIVKLLVTELVHDSRKHSTILTAIVDTIAAGTPIVSEEWEIEGGIDLKEGQLRRMSEDIGKHIRLEEDMIEIAKEAMVGVKNPVIRYLMNHILQDEEKHHEVTKNLLIWPYTGRWAESPAEFKMEHMSDKRGVGYEADEETRKKMGLL